MQKKIIYSRFLIDLYQIITIFAWDIIQKKSKWIIMSDKAFKDWYAMSDHALAAHIGAFVKHHRLEQNKTQEL